MAFHLSAICKRICAGAATVTLGLALLQTPGFAQVSSVQGNVWYAQYTPGYQTLNAKAPGYPVAITGNFIVDYIAIQCIACTQPWHIQFHTQEAPSVYLPNGTTHSTGFMLIPTSLGGFNYGAISAPATFFVISGSTNWELLFSSGGVTTTVVPPGVYVELSGHTSALP
jgi:hypothetical protein